MTLHQVKAWGAQHGVRAGVRRTRPAAVDPAAAWLLTVDGDVTRLAARSERQAWREAWALIQGGRANAAAAGDQLSLWEAA